MYKKITGVSDSKDQARSEVVIARNQFKEYNELLKNKKVEYQQIKKGNDQEREQIKRDQKLAEQFKFTKMTKKIAFLPALSQKEVFVPTNSVHAINCKYMDHRDKLKTYMPDKSYKKNIPKWNLQKTCDGEFFSKSVRQEMDVYDLDLLKYMNTWERGIQKPPTLKTAVGSGPGFGLSTKDITKNEGARTANEDTRRRRTQSEKPAPLALDPRQPKDQTQMQTERYMPKNGKVWNPNQFFPKLLGSDNQEPLLDNTHTPRGAAKAIALERSFNRFAWMYNRASSEAFDSEAIKADKKKSQVLKKQIRQKKKSLHSLSRGLNLSNNYGYNFKPTLLSTFNSGQ